MDADFAKEHPYIYLSVDGENMIFQITALFITDIGFDYIAPDPMGDDLTSFFKTIARKNWLDFDGVTFSEEDMARWRVRVSSSMEPSQSQTQFRMV
jgi:sortase B